jgi:diadenosine tetraphosphate (Ap4A) HIT family hydrolase
MAAGCPLCETGNATVLWRDDRCRVILVGDADYPGFCRVIWHEHVREMTDLDAGDREHCLRVVLAVEQVLREILDPAKINLAALGNQVPHLHWHVIPRFADDAHFPDAVWAARRREGHAHRVDAERIARRLRALLARDAARESERRPP